MQGGQGVFGIALGGVWHELEGTLAELPTERADVSVDAGLDASSTMGDELALRRQARHAG